MEEMVLEEWSASSSRGRTRTAILTLGSSGNVIRKCKGSHFVQLRHKLLSAFLPEGFPSSVTSDYLPFQIWDTLQGLSTYIRCMLFTQALLSAIGVGETTATVVGATFQWFLRDFTGMLAGIVFTLSQSSNLDSNAKMWRLVADIMNDLGMLMDLISPLYPSFFGIILCLGSISRSFTGVASGATRAALTQHFALQQNAADISVKEGSQETLAIIFGMLIGMLLAHFTAGDPFTTWSSFLLLTLFHIFANYKAVRSLCLNTLNRERTSILLHIFLNSGQGKYLLLPRKDSIDVVLDKHAESADILQSYIHALFLAHHIEIYHSTIDNSVIDSISWMDKYYVEFISKLQTMGWSTQRLLVPFTDWRADWKQYQA